MDRFATGLLSFASSNQLTINTTIWAGFSSIFSTNCKNCSVTFFYLFWRRFEVQNRNVTMSLITQSPCSTFSSGMLIIMIYSCELFCEFSAIRKNAGRICSYDEQYECVCNEVFQGKAQCSPVLSDKSSNWSWGGPDYLTYLVKRLQYLPHQLSSVSTVTIIPLWMLHHCILSKCVINI